MLVISCKPDRQQHEVTEIEPPLEEYARVPYDTESPSSYTDSISKIEQENEGPNKSASLDTQAPDINKKEETVKLPTKPKLGRIEFDSTIHHLPAMTEGDIVNRSFRFKNIGEGPLQIMTADVSCGCTTPTIPFLDILPGEYGIIGVDYSSVNKEGHQTPEIIITTNGRPQSVTLKIDVDIIPKSEQAEGQQDTLSN